MNGIEDLKDIADHTQRIGRVYEAEDRLSKQGTFSRFDNFADLPERIKDLLELAGTTPEPLQQIRWDLVFNSDNPFYKTIFEFNLPSANKDLAQLLVKLRTGSWRKESESGLLAFGVNFRQFGDAAVGLNMLNQFIELGKPEYEFYHLPLLEDLFRFAEAKSQTSVVTEPKKKVLTRRPVLRQAKGMQGRSITLG